MAIVNAEDVRIPRAAREAVARHEQVVVLNRERPVLAIVHPDEVAPPTARRRGRPVREVIAAWAALAAPDPAFAEDMEAIRRSVGPVPGTPWEQS